MEIVGFMDKHDNTSFKSSGTILRVVNIREWSRILQDVKSGNRNMLGKSSVQDQRIEQNSVGIALPGLPPLPWAVRSTAWSASITTVTTNNKQ